MKVLTPFCFLVLLIASCNEEEPKDPFTGNWQFDQSQAEFEIQKSSNGYDIKNIHVNGEAWTRGESRDVVHEYQIGLLIISKTQASSEGIVFYNCFPSESKLTINVDSVWLVSGLNKVVLYNQKISKSD